MDLVGFVNALLMNVSAIAGSNDPQTKVSPVGFLRMLLENNAVTEINNINELRAGQDRTVKVRYQQRGLESDVVDTDDCDTTITPEWKEASVGHPLFSKIGIFISDENMRKYAEEATNTVGGTPLMKGLYETLVVKINGLLQKIDSNLVAAQALKFGANAAYSLSTSAQSVVIGKSTDLDEGFVQLTYDAAANEINDDFLICGNGRVLKYDILQKLKGGFDHDGIGALNIKVYNDQKTTTAWGANHFGVFGKGTIGFVDWNKNVGAYAGEKGGSIFFTLPVPVELSNGELSSLTFDCQLKYVDCPVYSGSTKVADRGWKLLISKNYGLFNIPSDAYASSDRLYGVNGSFHYVAAPKDNTVVVSQAAPVAVVNAEGECLCVSQPEASSNAETTPETPAGGEG